MANSRSNGLGLNHPNRFFVGGRWIEPSSDAKIDVIMPSTEEIILSVAEAQEEDINRAVAAAREAFDRGPWPFMSHSERAIYLRAIAVELRRRQSQFADIWTSEVGIIRTLGDHLGESAAQIFDFYASLADTYSFIERKTPATGNTGLLVREPVGVVGAITAWNGALGLAAYKAAPALLAGCTIVIKSSPEAPGSAYLLAEIAEFVGLPAGVMNVVTARREVSELLVRHKDVDKIAFTGSVEAGRIIGGICGSRLARCTLELGGKSPAIVLDDYDLGNVADEIASSATLMNGQVCASLTRIIVDKKRQSDLVDALSDRFSKIRVGDPFDRSTQMGPLAMSRQRDRVEGYIAEGISEGAIIAAGGGRPASLERGFYIEPTVFRDVHNSMKIAREEIFGPVVSVIPVNSEAEAIDVANDSIYGLNASVFTNDTDQAYRISRRLRSGTVGHNAQRVDFSIAFGGFKQSGIGREGGVEGLSSFLELKTIILDGDPDGVMQHGKIKE